MITRFSLKRISMGLSAVCLLAFAAFLTGCQTTEPQFQDVPPDAAAPTPSTSESMVLQQPAPSEESTAREAAANHMSETSTSAVVPQSSAADTPYTTDTFRIGDTVSVEFSGLTTTELPKPHEERIKDDGTITLYLVGTVKAAGKNPGDLQRELQKEYDKYYKNLVVTVSGIARVFYVGGEVKRPNAYPYLGATTLTKAIQTAGDFTDFAKKNNIQITRADGTTITVNFSKATEDSRLDPPIYPGDTIRVRRRILW